MASFCSAFRNAAKNEYFNRSSSEWVSGKKTKRKDKTDALCTKKKKEQRYMREKCGSQIKLRRNILEWHGRVFLDVLHMSWPFALTHTRAFSDLMASLCAAAVLLTEWAVCVKRVQTLILSSFSFSHSHVPEYLWPLGESPRLRLGG